MLDHPCYIETMFDARYRRYIQSFLLVLPMTGLVCAINTFVARGAEAVFTMGTLERWGISLVIAFPAVLLVQPFAIKLTNRLIKKAET
jgi:hypothetical protein